MGDFQRNMTVVVGMGFEVRLVDARTTGLTDKSGQETMPGIAIGLGGCLAALFAIIPRIVLQVGWRHMLPVREHATLSDGFGLPC